MCLIIRNDIIYGLGVCGSQLFRRYKVFYEMNRVGQARARHCGTSLSVFFNVSYRMKHTFIYGLGGDLNSF